MKNWIIFLILGAAGYYIYKKGQAVTSAAQGIAPAGFLSTMKSGLFSSASALLPGIAPAYTVPAYSAPVVSNTPSTGAVITGSSGGGGGHSGGYDNNLSESSNTLQMAYFTRDLTKLTPFVNL